MEINEDLRDAIFEIVENQMKDNNPPQTKETFKRLRKSDYDDFVCKQLIGQCVAFEIFRLMNFGEAFNMQRYIKHLKALPAEPQE